MLLAEYMEQHKEFARDYKNSSNARTKYKKQWDKLASLLNAN